MPGVQTCALPDRKSTRLNSSHTIISYAVFCLKKEQPAPLFPSLVTHTISTASTARSNIGGGPVERESTGSGSCENQTLYGATPLFFFRKGAPPNLPSPPPAGPRCS